MSDHSQWLRGLAEKGGKGVVNNIDARCLGRIADEIDHLRPYVDAFRREEDRADKLGRDVDELREQLVRKDAALNHARVRFECLTDYFEEIADETMQAMSSVDADRMIAALTDEKGDA